MSEFHYENGVICRHRKMDYEKNQVTLQVNIAGGVIEETTSQLGLTRMAASVLNQPSSSFGEF